MKSKYREAYDTVEQAILNDKILKNNTRIVALLGSVADGEESSTWSDLDILIVLRANTLGTIDIEHHKRLRNICDKVSSQYPFEVSFLPHTEDDFEKYVCFEYLIHYSTGIATYPRKDSLRSMIFTILDARGVSEEERRSYCLYHLRHIRFNYFRKYVSTNQHNARQPSRKVCMLLIDKMLKVTDLLLNYYDKWPATKKEIVSFATEMNRVDTLPLKTAFSMRKRWEGVTEEEAEGFLGEGNKYLVSVIEYLLSKENNRSTPEELMTNPDLSTVL